MLFGDKENLELERQVKNQSKVSSIMITMRTNNKLKQLNLNPLSVAKYFYEKLGERGVEQTFLQPITYLAYQEILKKENVLLFKEEFQNGLASPVLISLKDLIRNHGNRLDKFFSSVPNLDNQLVLSYFEKLTKKYSKSFDCEIQYQAQNNYEKQSSALV